MAQLESVKGLNLEKIETFAQLTEQAATQWGNKTGLIFDQYNEILTFHDIHKQSNRIANVLLKLGVKQGDKVALMMDNRPAFPLTWLALGKIGAMMVPINIYYKEDETHYLLENAEVSVVLSTAKYVPMLKRIKAKLDHLQQIIAVDDCDEEEFSSYPHFLKMLTAQIQMYPSTERRS